MDTVQRADERKASKPNEIKYTQNDSEEELEPPSPIHISSEAALTPDFDFSDPHELRRIESDTQKRLKAILEVAGVTGLSQIDARTFQDPEILRKLTNSVSTALDEAATALTRMKSEKQTYEAFLRGANQAPPPTATAPGHPQQAPLAGKPTVAKEQQQAQPSLAQQLPLLQQQQQQQGGPNDSIQAVQRLLSQSHHGLQDATEDGESLLSLACSAGYYELAEVLLRMRASVEDRGIKGDSTPLMEAASGGYADIVKLLIDHGANVNAKSSVGNTALTYACCGGYEDVVNILVENAADVEHQNENGHTPLMEAASCGHVGVAKLLLEFGANINTHSNEFKESALTLACYKGHLEMVKFLLDAGADQEHKTDEMHTALMEASMDGHVDVARLLLDHGAQVNMPVDSFESPLTLAACGGHFQLAELLLLRGADLEEVNDEGYTPLMEASREGHEDVVKLLVERGANVNAQTEETQETALTLACCGGFLEVAQYLIEKGADIELGASSPLMEAAQEGHVDIVKFLIEKSASIHAETNTQDTALTYACANGHTVIADILLQHSAELEHESEGGRTPLMKAARAGHLQTVQFLVSKGADVNHRTATNDHSVLSLACAGGHVSVVQYLLMQGSDPAHILKDNSTMLLEAARGGHTAVASLILRQPKCSSEVVVRSRVASVTKCGTGEEESRSQEAVPQTVQKFQGKVVLTKTYSDPGTVGQLGGGAGQHGGGAQEGVLSNPKPVQQKSEVRPDVSVGQEKSKVIASKPNPLPDANTTGSIQRHSEGQGNAPSSTGSHLAQLPKAEPRPQSVAESLLKNNQHGKGEELGNTHLTQSEIIIRNYMQQQEEAAVVAVARGNTKSNGGGPTIAESAQALAQSIFTHGSLKTALPSKTALSAQPQSVVTQSLAQVAPPLTTTVNLDSGRLLPALDSVMPESLSAAVGSYLAAISQGHVIPNLEELARSLVASDRGEMTPGEEMELRQTLQRATESHSSLELERAHKGQRGFSSALLQDCNFPANIPPPSDLVPDHIPTMPPSGYMGSTLENDSYPTSEDGEEEEEDEDEEEEDLEEEEGSDSSYIAQDMASLPPGSYEPAIDIDQHTESNHDTALTLAAAGGHDELVELLLAHGSNIEHRDKKGCTSLILAASAGHAVTVAILLDHNADIEAQSERTKDTALSLACSGGRQEVVELLLAKGANFEHRNVSDYTPLSLAASGGYVNIIKLLLRAGADINSRTGSKLGISPLMLAAMNGHTSTVKLLLDMGSDISAQIETNRNTALTLACFQGRHEVVNLLVERQANVEHRAKTGLTPLMEAASGGYHEVGKVLIAKGADVNAAPVPSSRDTALTIAADKGHCKFVHLLLTHAAHVDVKNKKGNSPLWLACNGGHLDVVRLLVEHEPGADVDSQDNRKVSCLMAAFRKGHSKVVKYLVEYVTQFPSDADLTRYINTLSDKELLKKCQRCMDVIIDAKERQAAEANKNATILLQELDLEKKHEEDRKAAAARKRAKKKRQKEKKQAAQKGQSKDKSNSDNGEDDDADDGDGESLPLTNAKYSTVESSGVVSVTDANEQQKSLRLSAGQGKEREKDKQPPRVPLSNSVASLTVGPALLLGGNGGVAVSPRKNKKDDGWKEVGRRTKKIVIPSVIFLQIIGKGSCNISAIKLATNTQIEVDKHNKHGTNRVLTIRGSTDAIKLAHQYLAAFMEDPSRDIAQVIPKAVTKAMSSAGARHPMNHELLSTQTVSEDMLPASDTSSTAASVPMTITAASLLPSKAAGKKSGSQSGLGGAANAKGAGSAHPANGKGSKAARKGQAQVVPSSGAEVETKATTAPSNNSNVAATTRTGGSASGSGGGVASKPAGMPSAARKLFATPPTSVGAVPSTVSAPIIPSAPVAPIVPTTSVASKSVTAAVSSGSKPSIIASAPKPAAFAVPSSAKHPGPPRPTEAAKPKVVDVAGEVSTRATKQLLTSSSSSVATYSSVIGTQGESQPPPLLPPPPPLPSVPQASAIEQPLQQIMKTPSLFQEPAAQLAKPKKKSTYSDAVGKKPQSASDAGAWVSVGAAQFGVSGVVPLDSAVQQGKINLAPGAKPVGSDQSSEKSPSFEKQHKQNPWNEVDFPLDEGLSSGGLGPIGPPPGRSSRPGPSFSPGLPSSKTSPPTPSFGNTPYRSDTSPALKSPLLGPVPPALLPGPEKGLYSSAFQPIQPADLPLGEQGNNSVVTHVPTPVRNPRPPLLATPPGFNPAGFVQAESSVKNTSSPNKSPPHPTGKGFNPNAPSFVPTQQVLSSSSRPGPSNPPTSSILGNPPVFPATAGFVASGVGSSLLGTAPASMYGSYRLLPGTTNFGSPQVQPSLYQQPSLLGNPPPLNQAPLNPPLLGHSTPMAPLNIPVWQGQVAYPQSYDGGLASGTLISTSPVSFQIGPLRPSSAAPDLHAQATPGYKDPYAMDSALLPIATTQSLLIQGPAPGQQGSEFKYGLALGYAVKSEQGGADYEVSSSHLPSALLGQFAINLGQLSALPHQMSPMANCHSPEKASPTGREEGTFAYGPEVKYVNDGGVVADALLPIGTERAKRSASYTGNSGFPVIGQGINPKLWSFTSNPATSGDSDWSKATVSSEPRDWPNLNSGTERLAISPQDNLESVLEKLALTKYLQLFQSNEIDLDALLLMEEKDFSEIELPKGPRIKLLNALGRKPLDDIESTSNPNLSSPTSEDQPDHLDNSQPVLPGVHHNKQ